MEARIRRSERLKSKRAIDRLFREGDRIKEGKLLLLYRTEKGQGELRTGVTAPRKKLKKAHERNRTKRLLREAFRLNKERLRDVLKQKGFRADLFLLFKGRSVPSYEEVEKEMIRILERWEKALRSENPEERDGKNGS